MVVFFVMPWVMEFLGGSSLTMAEMHRLIGTGALDPSGYVLLGILVVVVAALCMLTSRFGVYRILNANHERRIRRTGAPISTSSGWRLTTLSYTGVARNGVQLFNPLKVKAAQAGRLYLGS